MKMIPGQMYTYSGKMLDLLNPTVEMFDIEDIAKGLAYNCHFSGQMPKFFSLAEHSMMVEDKVAKDFPVADFQIRLIALMHDGTEGLIGDMIKPLKVLLPEFGIIEDRLMEVIFRKFNLPIERIVEIKPADIYVQQLEYAANRNKDKTAFDYILPEHAYECFLERFHYLNKYYKKQF